MIQSGRPFSGLDALSGFRNPVSHFLSVQDPDWLEANSLIGVRHSPEKLQRPAISADLIQSLPSRANPKRTNKILQKF